MSLDGLRVLIVEDEYLLARQVSAALRGERALDVTMAPSVARALACLDAEPQPHVAMLDVNLAGEKVYPVADRLRQLGIPFLFCSGFDAQDLDERFREVTHLSKPFSVSSLILCLSRLADGSGRSGAAEA